MGGSIITAATPLPMWNNRTRAFGSGGRLARRVRIDMSVRSDNLDRHGFRPNVGIVIHNDEGQVLWGRRVGGFDAWQFPQGGIERGESIEEALYRELGEEVGLTDSDVEIRSCTKGWLHYRTPENLRRRDSSPAFMGQKQRWFLLRLLVDDDAVRTDHGASPEFDDWRWVSYWYPVGQVIAFKRGVYRRALRELAPALHVKSAPRATQRGLPPCSGSPPGTSGHARRA